MSVYALLQMARTLVLALAIATACGAPKPRGRGDGVTPGLGPENTIPVNDSPMERCSGPAVLTLEDLAAGTGNGELVAIELVPQVVQSYCTLLDCGDAECCNSCGGSYGARLVREPADRDLELYLTGSQLAGCSGMECNFHCEPFGRKPTTKYVFVGMNKFQPAGVTSVYHQATIAVEQFCPLDG